MQIIFSKRYHKLEGPLDHPPSQHTMCLLLYWCCNSTTGSMVQIKLNVSHLHWQFSCCQIHLCKQQPEHSKQMEVCLFWAYQSLKPQHASHTETECNISEMDHWSTAGECCVTVTQHVWKQNMKWELPEKERCSQIVFKTSLHTLRFVLLLYTIHKIIPEQRNLTEQQQRTSLSYTGSHHLIISLLLHFCLLQHPENLINKQHSSKTKPWTLSSMYQNVTFT